MKKILLTLFTISIYVYSAAQNRKLEVLCEVRDMQLSYAGMDKVLPDSVKGYFVKLDKKSRLFGLSIVNYLSLYGWSLVGYGESRESSLNYSSYLLKRELVFCEEDYQVVLKQLTDWMKH